MSNLSATSRCSLSRNMKYKNSAGSAINNPAAVVTKVKLIDFGVARHLDEEGSLAMTRLGAVLGRQHGFDLH